MKKKLILFLILVLVGFFVCYNEQSNKLEDLLANLEKKDDTNEFEKNKLLWESVIKKVWLKETWNSSETYEDMSFVITRVEKSKLWGAFLKKGILRPDSDLYSEKQNHNMMLTGNFNENRAELTIEALEAEKLLAADGIHAEIINIHTIKPIDRELVVASAKKTGKVVTVEEHSVIGGLGSAVCDVLCEEAPTKVLKIGVNDVFGESGPALELLHKYELDGEGIYKKVKAFVK